MDKPSKCKHCQWYGKPYWSIINPCDNCPYEEINTTITIDNKKIINDFVNDKNFTIIFNYVSEPYEKTIIEQDKEIARLKKEHKKIIDMAIHFINLHQDSKTLSLDYFDLKKLRGLLNNDKFYIKLFKDELKELKEEGKNE